MAKATKATRTSKAIKDAKAAKAGKAAKHAGAGKTGKPIPGGRFLRDEHLVPVDEPVQRLPPMALGASPEVLNRLWQLIARNRDLPGAESHSTRLLARGTVQIAQKLGEEAVECVIELLGEDRAAMIGESADLLYHLLVAWVHAGIAPDDVWRELQQRESVSDVVRGVAIGRSRLPGILSVGTTKIP